MTELKRIVLRLASTGASGRKVQNVTERPSFVHDMKNMLGIIIGYSNLLLEETAAEDPRRGDLEEIRKAGETALALLQEWGASGPGEELR